MPEPGFSEHRSERRSRVLKGASILTGITNSEIVCTVRNPLRVSVLARSDAPV